MAKSKEWPNQSQSQQHSIASPTRTMPAARAPRHGGHIPSKSGTASRLLFNIAGSCDR